MTRALAPNPDTRAYFLASLEHGVNPLVGSDASACRGCGRRTTSTRCDTCGGAR